MHVRCANFTAVNFGLFLAFAQVTAAHAAELKIWTARAIATVLNKVRPQFEQASGHKLEVTSRLLTQFIKRINAGERFDILVFSPAYIDGLIKEGKIIAGTRSTTTIRP